MSLAAADADGLARVAATIEAWAEVQRRDNPVVVSVEADAEQPRWYVRVQGEEKAIFTVWLTVRQRTLHAETYFMPAPEERAEELYELLLRVNSRLVGLHFAIGAENAVYLTGHMAVVDVDDAELDRLIGTAYAYTEQYFRAAMRIGYGAKFKG